MTATVVVLTSGTSWTVPAGVTSVDVETWGAGSGAHYSGGGYIGGGGGAYAATTGVTVTPGGSVTISIGAGGTNDTSGSPNTGTRGGDTCFGGTTLGSCIVGAIGGGNPNQAGGFNTAIDGGLSTGCVGTTTFSGGTAFNGFGGGGSSAGPDGAGGGVSVRTGGRGDNNLGGLGGVGGPAIAGPAGAANVLGGGGGGGGGGTGHTGGNGGFPGGGVGGCSDSTAQVGASAGGQIRLTYTASATNPTGTIAASSAASMSASGSALISGGLTASSAASMSASGSVSQVGGITATSAATIAASGSTLVAGGVAASSAATMSASGSSVTATTGALAATSTAAMASQGSLLVTGGISMSAAAATMSAHGSALVSGGLSRTSSATMAAAGTTTHGAPISGTLAQTISAKFVGFAVVPRPSAAARRDLSVVPYVPSPPPITGNTNEWMLNELNKLQATIASMTNASLQVAYKAPDVPLEGMIRMAKGPWAVTFGGTPDAGLLVKYHSGTWSAL